MAENAPPIWPLPQPVQMPPSSDGGFHGQIPETDFREVGGEPSEALHNLARNTFVAAEIVDGAQTAYALTHIPGAFEGQTPWAFFEQHLGTVPGIWFGVATEIAAVVAASQVAKVLYNALPQRMRSRWLETCVTQGPYIIAAAGEAMTVISNLAVFAGFHGGILPHIPYP